MPSSSLPAGMFRDCDARNRGARNRRARNRAPCSSQRFGARNGDTMEGMGSGARIAFFGGSFDPPHLGHLAIARAARDALQLDRVLFAPVGAQPLKPKGSTASFEDRLAMTELAIAGERGFEVSLADAPH